MKNIGVIPARMESSRFPGKPLKNICGIPMIAHCWIRSKMSKLDEVYIATCNEEISSYAKSLGARVIMTGNHHERASDRVAEAVSIIEKDSGETLETVTLIQGDEPFVNAQMINLALDTLMAEKNASVVNLMSVIDNEPGSQDPNEVKVVTGIDNYALYFSRARLPDLSKTDVKFDAYRQICVIPFTRNFLFEYSDLEPTPLEIIESVDMLRVLEHGHKIKMAEVYELSISVDTPDDLAAAEALMINDILYDQYKNDV